MIGIIVVVVVVLVVNHCFTSLFGRWRGGCTHTPVAACVCLGLNTVLNVTKLLHPNILLEIVNVVACINHRFAFLCGPRYWLASYQITYMRVWFTMLGSLYIIGLHRCGPNSQRHCTPDIFLSMIYHRLPL